MDYDHLYEFIVEDLSGVRKRIVHDYVDSCDTYASQFRIGELPLDVGDDFVFHYDFGRDVMIDIKLEAVSE